MNIKQGLTLLALAFAMTLPVPAATAADRAQATQAALDAFFSMEQARPEGTYGIAPPHGFKADETDENALIEYLTIQKRQGADVNEYRHLGTPLHHAIRSGLHDTARWLIKNGANPRLRIKGGDYDTETAPDALGVAVSVGAWDLFDDLRRLPVYKAMSADEQARALWPHALNSAELTAMLLSKRVPLPRFSATPKLSDSLLLHSLCTGHPRLAQPLLAQADAPVQPPIVREASTLCPLLPQDSDSASAKSQAPAAAPLPAAGWKAVEARLQWPVLPFVVMRVQTAAQATQWLTAGLRQPWGEPVATVQYLRSALQTPQAAALVLLRAVPPAPLQLALHNPAMLTIWLKVAANWPLGDLRWALAQVDGGVLASKLGQVMQDWSYAQATRRDAKDGKDRMARWTLLTDRLTAPLTVLTTDGFLYWVPIELWPRWLSLGLRVDDAQWASWLNGADPAPFEQAWPVIVQHQPAVAKRTLAWLVAPLSVGPVEDPQTKRLSYGSYTYHYDAAFLRKAKFLQVQRAQAPQARWLAGGYQGPETQPGIAFAMAHGWVRMPPENLGAQVEPAPLQCQQRPRAAMRRSLATTQALEVEELNGIQPLARPGQTDCVWLISGSTGGGRRDFSEESFSGGVQVMRPCTDGNGSAALWSEARSAWLPVKGESDGGLIPLRHKTSGENFFASLEMEYGSCGGKAGSVLMPRYAADGALQLEPLESGHPLFDALVLQCDLRGLSSCSSLFGKAQSPADAPAAPFFADLLWPKEKAAFLAAIDQLDRTALAQARADGVFAPWLDEALRRISSSTALTLPEMRQRSAWVLAQRTPRPSFASETLDALLPWMPAEDWGPVISALQCGNRHALTRLAEQAQEKKLTVLQRRLRTALLQPCAPPKK